MKEKELIKSANLFPVVGIGASAGGLDAFKKLLKAIPENSGMAFVLVQHLDPNHESMLPEILQKVTSIPVLEIADDIKVEPNHIYVIPSNKMMVATDGILLLAPRPAKSKTERNLPIDLFFTSLAEVHQAHAIGVVLSGTATDGTLGLKAIKDHGGITFAQDEASAEYEGMPQSAVHAGVVDFILPPGEIPKKLLEVTSKIVLSDDELQNIPQQDEDIFRQILSLLRIRKGTDFTYYKQTTIRRRILRRIVVNKNEELADYLKFLRGSTTEQDLLYQDLLIPVTSFFRDKKTFDNLCDTVFPKILKNKIPGEITRVWVAGCSTGQEVYSFAICFKEFLGDNHERIQIFGTDLSEPAITKARTGMYEKTELDSVSPQRLKEYFTKTNGSYQVNKSIRDLCIFAHHNFLKDPPFGKMDCISCRNVLIYMEPYLQKKALTTFHYALNPKGFLLLGKSETTSGVPDLFAAVGKNDKLFTRKDVPGRFMQVTSQRSEQILNRTQDVAKNEIIRTDFQKTADDILLSKYTPAGVVINEAMDIVHFRGSTGNYLEQSPGKTTHNLLMMAKHGLAFELRNILHKAKREKIPVAKENIPLQINESLHNISIEAIPLPNTLEPYYLVLFHDHNLNVNDGTSTGPGAISNRKKATGKTKKDDKDIRIQLLEQELSQAREDMRSITEDQEASNEELQSANEELLSGSEELQSLNEELETSKEELQSTNEELTVLNHELVSLNEQVTDARNYSESIVATIGQPLLVLDKNLRVKTANKAFYTTFHVDEQETEGVLIYDLGNRQWNIPQLRTLLEEILPQKTQITNFEVTHNFSSIGERVILLSALEITREKKEEKLILLSIENITERKQAEENSNMLSTIVNSSSDAIISKTLDGIIKSWNRGAEKIFGYSAKEIVGKPISLLIPPDLLQEEKMILGKINKGESVQHYETIRLSKNGTKLNISVTVSPIKDAAGKITGASKIARNITEKVIARKKVEESEFRYHEMIYSSPSMIAIFKGEDMIIEIANDAIIESWGKGKDVVGKPLLSIMPEIVEQGFDKIISDVYKTGVPFHAYEAPVSFVRNGKMELFHFTFVYQAQRSISGAIEGVAVIANEVTPQALSNINLKESEERFRSLADNVPIHIFIMEPDAEATISYWNKNWLDYTGQIFEEAIGNAWGGVMHPDDVQPIMNVYLPALQNRQPYFLPAIRVKRHDGEYRWHSVQANPRYLPNGEFMGYIGIGFDIHESKLAQDALKASEEHFRMMADLMPAKISNASVNGEVTYFNKNWLEFSGYTFEELRDFGYHQMMHPDEMEEFQQRFQEAAATGTDLVMEMRFKNKTGDYIWHLNIASPVKDEHGNIKMWVGVTTDITEQINTRTSNLKTYEIHSKELEEKVQQRTFELSEANYKLLQQNDELEKMNTELESFTYVASHDLQEPLRKIQTFANRILEKEQENLSATGKDYFSRMQAAAARMQQLIEDLLAFSRINTTERKFENVELNNIIEEIKTELKDIILEKNATIASKEFSPVNIIPFQFRQLMYNLISNALKFSKPGTSPDITISSSIKKGSELNGEIFTQLTAHAGMLSPEKSYCHITVKDNGIGFEPHFNERIFEVFQKLHGKEEYAGTGIGLAIVKKIVENHNGIITATGELDKGASFDIYIPAL